VEGKRPDVLRLAGFAGRRHADFITASFD